MKKPYTVLLLIIKYMSLHSMASAATTLAIPQVPLLFTTTAYPQIVLAIANSESMDGLMNGAIMTGSGILSSNLTSLYNSSSPVRYTVPSGFTPPLVAADQNNTAPYTVDDGEGGDSTLRDNGPSRLNVAKAGALALINNFMGSTDFALATYKTSTPTVYTTWVYYISPDSGFSFNTNTNDDAYYVNNPCYLYNKASSAVNQYCTNIANYYGVSTLKNNPYMKIAASSDDPAISDVLYAPSFPGVLLSYNGPNPASPYPPYYSLANYNSGSIVLSYYSSKPSGYAMGLGPTNAGYVPYSPEVLYAQRGFGYYGIPYANTGNIVVPMTSAGSNPTPRSISQAINTFVPYLQPETNRSRSSEIKSCATQSPTAGLLNAIHIYLNGLSSNTTQGCTQKRYVLLLSDGLPTQDVNGRYWPPLGSAAATGYGVKASFNSDGSLQSTNSKAVSDTIQALGSLLADDYITIIVGLGAGIDPYFNPQAASTLVAMAIAGGSGGYYPATSPDILMQSLNQIMTNIQSVSATTTATSVNSNTLSSNSIEYVTHFMTQDKPYNDWTGDLTAQALDPQTGLPTAAPLWSAQTQLDTLASGTGWSKLRQIVTWDSTANQAIPFQWNNLNTMQQYILNATDKLGTNRLNYLRGSTADELRNGSKFRNRSHLLGDIVDSQPVYVGAPIAPYLTTSYINFRTAQANRQAMIYVGANDGMLHAFNAGTGIEQFAFIPNGIFGDLPLLTNPSYNSTHQYFVNGAPQAADVQFTDTTWHTVLVGTEGAGGNTVFALDVSNPGSITSEQTLAKTVLWEFADSSMGLGMSRPQIAQITASNQYAVFFGNGYNNPNNTSMLYALDPKTGALIRKIDLCAAVAGACNNSLPQGLSSVTMANKDGLLGQAITHIYAGDLQGNLWSVDVSSSNPAQWSVRLLFQARDASNSPQAITTPVVVTLNPQYPRQAGLFLLFGTGQLLTQNDLTTTQTQTLYGIWDKPGNTNTYTRANLLAQKLSVTTVNTVNGSTQAVTATSNTVNWTTQAGWYDDIPISGMRLITEPTLYNGVFIATLNTPPLNACSTTFSSMLFELDYANGGALSMPMFDLDGSGQYDSHDQINGLNPIGLSLGNQYANAPTILKTSDPSRFMVSVIKSDGSRTALTNPNLSPLQTGWIRIQ